MPPPLALLVPGAGSTPDFLHRAFDAPLARLGLTVHAVDHAAAGGPQALAEQVAALRPVLLGGVSHGAHLATRLAATAPPGVRGLLAVMPAWTGAPGPVAGVTAATARRLRAEGMVPLLDELAAGLAPRDPRAWVVAELRRGWSSWPPGALADHLADVATSPGPTSDELARVAVPVGLVTLADDPLHPATAADEWAAALPRTGRASVPLAAPGVDLQALGRAGVQALLAAGVDPGAWGR